jgi:glutamine synthetase
MYNLGIEQEFFILRKDLYEKRMDLTQTGRTLYGALPPKNQQFCDHYYGRVDDRIFEILNKAENELLKLGVPMKTKHREVAINQYEVSSYYEDAVVSVDHNMLVMDTLKSVFDKHGYTVLFHEKPFQGANGSGKHCNWSLAYSKNGKFINLLEPGPNPEKNVMFVLFILMTLKAVK